MVLHYAPATLRVKPKVNYLLQPIVFLHGFPERQSSSWEMARYREVARPAGHPSPCWLRQRFEVPCCAGSTHRQGPSASLASVSTALPKVASLASSPILSLSDRYSVAVV